MSAEARLVWSAQSAAHKSVIGKYARRVKGGALSICERTGKVIYGTATLAALCEEELRAAGSTVQYVYACKYCTRWHLTRQRQAREGEQS